MFVPDPGTNPRIFLALWPDDEVRQAITDHMELIFPIRARWVDPEKIHMTLSFLGNVASEHVPAILSRLRAVRFSRFSFNLDYLLYLHRSRMLWLTPKARSEPLLRLVKELSENACKSGTDQEIRRFAPHVTIARKVTVRAKCQSIEAVLWPVSSFCLVESKLGSHGSHYFVRQEWSALPYDIHMG